MRKGYIRLSKAGPTLEEQQVALRAAGVADFSDRGPVYVDVLPKGRAKPGQDATPQRTECIRRLRSDDELVIASAARLGTSRADVLRALEGIGQRGAAVFDCSTGERVQWHPDALSAIAFAERAETEVRKEITAKMRRRRVELGAVAGPPMVLKGARLEKAREAWADLGKSGQQVADEFNVGVRTLYRRFGPKGTPVFGKKGRKA